MTFLTLWGIFYGAIQNDGINHWYVFMLLKSFVVFICLFVCFWKCTSEDVPADTWYDYTLRSLCLPSPPPTTHTLVLFNYKKEFLFFLFPLSLWVFFCVLKTNNTINFLLFYNILAGIFKKTMSNQFMWTQWHEPT